MRHDRRGFTFLELLVVIAVLGIVFAIGFRAFPRDVIIVNQAVERFERDLERVRFNAISYNTVIVFSINSGTDSYGAVPEPDVATVTRARFTVELAREGVGGVAIAPVVAGSSTCEGVAANGVGVWRFDQRGVGRAGPASLVTFEHATSGYSVSLCVNAYGRVVRV